MPRKRTRVERICTQCGATFSIKASDAARGGVYCRRSCYAASVRMGSAAIIGADGGARIPLRARDGRIRAYALIDAADAEWVSQWRWGLSSKGYAIRFESMTGRRISVLLHRELLGLPRVKDVLEGDHIDRDRLNDQRSNLRVSTRPQGMQNKTNYAGSSSQYRGVSWKAKAGKWQAAVCIDRKVTYLGLFTDEREAAEVARTARARLMPFAME